MRYGDAFGRWTRALESAEVPSSIIHRHRYAVLRFMWDIQERRKWDGKLADITEGDVLAFLGAGINKRAHSKRWYVEGLASFFGFALKRGYIKDNPAKHLVAEPLPRPVAQAAK